MYEYYWETLLIISFYLIPVVKVIESFTLSSHSPKTIRLSVANHQFQSRYCCYHQKLEFRRRDANSNYVKLNPSFYHNGKSSTILKGFRREIEEARMESELEHQAECKRSEDLFFYHTTTCSSSAKDGVSIDVHDSGDCENEDKNTYNQQEVCCEFESFYFPVRNDKVDRSVDNEKEILQSDNIISVIDSKPPYPFTQHDLAKVSKVPLFTKKECSSIIDEAETLGQWRNAQSQASYAKNASTFYQIRKEQLPQTKQWLDEKLKGVIYPIMSSTFSHIPSLADVSKLRCSAASIVKYNATAGQTSLGLHRDAPLLALTIPLNGLDEYHGGGTFIEALGMDTTKFENEPWSSLDSELGSIVKDDYINSTSTCEEIGCHDNGTLRRDTGYLIIHPAMLRHAGKTITHGLRYILVIWIFSIDFIAWEHYSLIRANKFLAQALRIGTSSNSQYRLDLLEAAISGYEEALKLGSGNVTESALIGLGQAMLEVRSFSRLNDDNDKLLGVEDTRHLDKIEYEKNMKVTQDALKLFNFAIKRAPTNRLACQMKDKAIEILKEDYNFSDDSIKNALA